MDGFLLLASIFLKTSALLLFAAVVAGLLASSSAALRHWLWACALVMCLAMPLAIVLMPSLTILPSSWAPPGTAVVSSTVASASTAIEPAASAKNPAANFRLANAWPSVLTVWSIGTVALLLREVLAQAGLARWRRRARPLRSGGWTDTLESLPFRQYRRLTVLESPDDRGPCAWGLVRPVLLLPASGNAWSASRRRHALLHEQAHLDRHDAVTTLLARMACAIHWFNPLVWFAAAQLRMLQEKACDDAVLRAGATPSDYAQFLLDLGCCKQSASMLPAALGMIGGSPLQKRIRSILDGGRSRKEAGRAESVAGLWMLGVLSAALAAIGFAAPQERANSNVEQSVPNPTPGDPSAAPPLPGRPAPPAPARTSSDASKDGPPSLAKPPRRPAPPPAPLPPAPGKPARAALPALPAEPTPPPVPAIPAVPAAPAIAALPALPAMPASPPRGASEHVSRQGSAYGRI